jgi:hypothetical protein
LLLLAGQAMRSSEPRTDNVNGSRAMPSVTQGQARNT